MKVWRACAAVDNTRHCRAIGHSVLRNARADQCRQCGMCHQRGAEFGFGAHANFPNASRWRWVRALADADIFARVSADRLFGDACIRAARPSAMAAALIFFLVSSLRRLPACAAAILALVLAD